MNMKDFFEKVGIFALYQLVAVAVIAFGILIYTLYWR